MSQTENFSPELANFDRLPDSAYVRLQTVMRLYGMSAATVWRHSGKSIPAPHKLTKSITRWNVGELRSSLPNKQKEA